MATRVKICGLTQPAQVERAGRLGAAFLGFVFYPPSPRAVDPALARELVAMVPDGAQSVGLIVDASDHEIETLLDAVPLDLLQLHGHETPERIRAIGLRFGCRTIKALRVETADDLVGLDEHADAADMILFDAKPPRDAAWPGGHGLPFDWRALEGRAPGRPWLLAGGLTAGNVAAALALTKAPILDVSSGVESRPGVKDPAKLDAFFAAVARADGESTR